MPRSRPHVKTLGPAALGELLKPARLEIYESLQTGGPGTAADLAQRLGRPADSLYYHLKKLLRVGVIQQQELDESGASKPGRNGAVYAAVSSVVTMKLDPASKKSREAWAGGSAAVLRLAQREVRSALEEGGARTEGPRRNLAVRRLKVSLTARGLARVNGLLEELADALRAEDRKNKGQRYAVTLALAPLQDRSQRKQS